MNKSIEQAPTLPTEGDYITEIEEIDPRVGINGKLHTKIRLKITGTDKILIMALFGNRLIEWNYIATQKARIKVRVKHKILDYVTPEEGKVIVADVQLREILVC